jgi:hypothetical protein
MGLVMFCVVGGMWSGSFELLGEKEGAANVGGVLA